MDENNALIEVTLLLDKTREALYSIATSGENDSVRSWAYDVYCVITPGAKGCLIEEVKALRAENEKLRKENAEIVAQYDILEHDYNLLKDEFDALECGAKSE